MPFAQRQGSSRIVIHHVMSFTLDKVVPWGRSFSEYQRMFALSEADLQKTILACADGPASFNSEATRLGASVVSCDPLYRFDAEAIRSRVQEVYPEMVEQTRRNESEFIWTEFESAEELGKARLSAMRAFLDDYDTGLAERRYIVGEFPSLPFSDNSFDLTLCSHYLFLYSEQLTLEFHVNAIRDMCRVSNEARIFPIVALGSGVSDFVEPVTGALRECSLNVKIESVPYEFKRGANQMMRVNR